MLILEEFDKVEMRVLGVDAEEGCVLLAPKREVPNGSKIF